MDSWIDSQVRFWYGDLYELVEHGEWEVIANALKTTDLGKNIIRFPRYNDGTSERIEKCYDQYGQYRFKITSDVLTDIVHYQGDISISHPCVFPIFMVDSINDVMGCISYNRSPLNRNSVLWPLPYHEKENDYGFLDDVPWDNKLQKLVFRGSCSTPLHSYNGTSGSMKPSRVEIVEKNVGRDWCDLGLIRPELIHEKDVDIQPLVKPSMSKTEQMKFKWVLCIEGADISSSFGWVLASNCLPFHTYPFNHEVWYFNGLEPWIHFIPVAPDGSDLQQKVEWCRENDTACRQIAMNGRVHMECMQSSVDEIKTIVSRKWRMPYHFF